MWCFKKLKLYSLVLKRRDFLLIKNDAQVSEAFAEGIYDEVRVCFVAEIGASQVWPRAVAEAESHLEDVYRARRHSLVA